MFDNVVIDKIEKVECWSEVPKYERLNIGRLIGYGFNFRDMINYLKKEKNIMNNTKDFEKIKL